MQSVEGVWTDGVARPAEPVEGHEGQRVIITFLAEDSDAVPTSDDDWNALDRLIDENAIDTGISDLAHQHDHYLYNTPKRT